MKIRMLKTVNLILGILFLNQAVTGMTHDKLDNEVFEILHQGGGLVLVILAVLHVILNWKWIRSNYFRK